MPPAKRKRASSIPKGHELRGPLAPLSYTLEVLKRSDGAPELIKQSAGAMHLQPQEPTAGEPAALSGRRVLVVDDNRDSANSLAMLLNMTGNETHVAYDGVEAVEAVAAFKPDVVLLDIGLPKMNGYEAARRIRAQPGGRKIALVALTGWGQDEDRQRSKDAGFDGHLVKPVEYAALTRLLAEARPA